MKKSIDTPSDSTRTILIFGAIIVICCISFLCVALYNTSVIGTETRIIKAKYASDGFMTDSCGHPILYNRNIQNLDINKIYEIEIISYRTGTQYITNITQVDKEKYIENC